MADFDTSTGGGAASRGMGIMAGGAAARFERRGPAQGIPLHARQLLEDARPAEPPAVAEEVEELIAPDSLAKPGGFLRPILNLALVLALIAALVAVSQAISLASSIRTLPAPLQPVAYVFLLVTLAVLAYFAVKFSWEYVRLRVSPALNITVREDLHRRDLARRELRAKHVERARRILTDLTAEYPVRTPKEVSRLKAIGFTAGELDVLQNVKYYLTGNEAPADHAKWLSVYDSEFLGTLDAVADRQVKTHLKRVFALTATIPRGGLDTAAVLWISYRMVGDLCRIYNVRANRWGTATIFGHLLVNVLAAGEIHDAASAAAGSVGDMAHHHLAQVTAAVLGTGAKLIGKAAEGGMNCLLLWRLSLRTREYLRPMRQQPAPPAEPVLRSTD